MSYLSNEWRVHFGDCPFNDFGTGHSKMDCTFGSGEFHNRHLSFFTPFRTGPIRKERNFCTYWSWISE